jgi:hypothetical protein
MYRRPIGAAQHGEHRPLAGRFRRLAETIFPSWELAAPSSEHLAPCPMLHAAFTFALGTSYARSVAGRDSGLLRRFGEFIVSGCTR